MAANSVDPQDHDTRLFVYRNVQAAAARRFDGVAALRPEHWADGDDEPARDGDEPALGPQDDGPGGLADDVAAGYRQARLMMEHLVPRSMRDFIG